MTPLRVMLAEFSWNAWIDVFAQLTSRGVVDPVYWSAIPAFEPAVTAQFPHCVFHGSMDASRGDPPGGRTTPTPRWTQAMLRVWRDDAQDIYAMLNRADLEGAFGLPERLDYLARQLALWDAILDELRPDVVVFPAAPHVGYDYVLYRLCVARGIRTLMFEWCLYGPHTFFFDRVEDGDSTFMEKYRQRLAQLPARSVELSDNGRAYLDKLRGEHRDAASIHYPDINRQAFGDDVYSVDERGRRVSIRKRLAEEVRRARTAVELSVNVFVDDFRHWRDGDPAPWESAFIVEKDIGYRNAVRGHFLRTRIYRKHRKWLKTAGDRERALREHAKPIPMDAPFVFVALHQQPERTTSPQGGVFVDQLKMIQLLSAAAPPGWRIVVKEHIAQLHPEALGHMYRLGDFYAAVAALPNTSWVSPFLPPGAMIDRCAVVATVTGTVGWEAVVRGQPAFTFGEAWYRGCEGVFRIRDFESCRAAFDAIATGFRVDPVKVDAFVETIERHQTQAQPQPPLLPYCTLAPEENSRRLAVALEARLRST